MGLFSFGKGGKKERVKTLEEKAKEAGITISKPPEGYLELIRTLRGAHEDSWEVAEDRLIKNAKDLGVVYMNNVIRNEPPGKYHVITARGYLLPPRNPQPPEAA